MFDVHVNQQTSPAGHGDDGAHAKNATRSTINTEPTNINIQCTTRRRRDEPDGANTRPSTTPFIIFLSLGRQMTVQFTPTCVAGS